MSQSNQPVKVDITSSFDARGTTEAKREIESLTTAVNKSGQAANDAGGYATSMRMATLGVASAAAVAGVAVLAYTGFQLGLARAYAETAEKLARLSEITGISIGELSQMNAVALTNDTTVEKLAMALKNLGVKQLEANSGNANAIALFKALGVEYEDGTGKLRRARDVMDDVATKFSEMENGSGKAAVAAKLLGRGLGEELIPYLNQGADGLKRAREEADKLGIKIDADTARAVKALNDDMTSLGLSVRSAALDFAGPLVRALNAAAGAMINARKEGAGLAGMLWAGLRGGVGEEQQAMRDLVEGTEKKLALEARIAQLQNSPGPYSKQSAGKIAEGRAQLAAVNKQIADANEFLASIKPPATLKNAAPDVLDKPERTGRVGGSTVDHEGNAIAQLRRQLMQREGASMQELVQQEINDGKYKGYSEATQQTLRDLAREIDLRKQNADAMKAEGAAWDEQEESLNKIAQMESQKLQQSVNLRENFANEALMIDAQLSRDQERIANTQLDLQKQAYQRQIAAVSVYTAEGVAEKKRLEDEYGKWLVSRQAQITEELKPEWQKMVDAYGNTMQAMRDFNDRFVTGGLRAGENAWVNWARTGKLSLKDLFGTLRDEIARTIYQQQIAKSVAGGLSFLGEAIAGFLFGGNSSYAADAVSAGGVSDAVIASGIMHGGYGPGDVMQTRMASPAMFAGAPRFHSGRSPREIPAIIRDDESVLTPGQMRQLAPRGAGNVTVNVINQSGQPMDAQASMPRFDGEQMIVDVVLKRMSRDAGMRDGMRAMLAAPV
jgi:Arc/MetJ-type ribon-helix-helix transcriptional regulator